MHGKSVSDMVIDASKGADATKKLMSPNAHEDPETVTGTNEQKAFKGRAGKPKGPFGPQGRMF